MNSEPEFGDEPSEQCAAALVDLHRHQTRIVLDDVCRHSHERESICGLESEKTTADHDADSARTCLLGGGPDTVEVVEGAVDETSVAVVPRHGRHERIRTGRHHQSVVGDRVAGGRRDGACIFVDRERAFPHTEVDQAVAVVIVAGQCQFLGVPRSDVRGQPDSVVRCVLLVAEYGHRPVVRFVARTQCLDESVSDHSVSDDNNRLAHHAYFLRYEIVLRFRGPLTP